MTTALALALFLLGCGSVDNPTPRSTELPSAPPGEPIDMIGYGTRGDMVCRDQWIEGSLLAGVAVQDRLVHRWDTYPTTIDVWPLDSIAWPSPLGFAPERFVPIRWPLEYTGLQLADGEVAVLDGAGEVLATTGRGYRLKGEWAVVGAVGGPLFGKGAWIDGFNVCRGSDAVIAQ